MAYRIKIRETPQQALRRIGLEQAERALIALSATADAGNPIHETRKCLKRIRALLKLVRPGLDDSVYKTENARYRDIARLLSPARDTDIIGETLVKLEAVGDETAAASIAALKSALAEPAATAAPEQTALAIEQARHQLAEAKGVMAKLKIAGRSFNPIEEGLRKSYRQGRRAFALAYETGASEALHDCRKGVQLHWRQMALVSQAWPEMFAVRVEAARQLSQILGEYQDLEVLLHHIKDLAEAALAPGQALDFTAFAHARQQHLRELAQPRGAQLFSASPKTLSRSISEAWDAARASERRVVKNTNATAASVLIEPRATKGRAKVTALRPSPAVKHSDPVA